MKAIEKFIHGQKFDFPVVLAEKLQASGAYLSLQVADDENEHAETLIELWNLPPRIFGRTMDNNLGRERRYSSNGYIYGVVEELVDEVVQVFSKIVGKTLKPLEFKGGFRVAGLAAVLSILCKHRDFPVHPIKSKKSRRRKQLLKAIATQDEVLPMFNETNLDVAIALHNTSLSAERQFPKGNIIS